MEIGGSNSGIHSFESLQEQIDKWGLEDDKQLRNCMKSFTENLIENIGKIQEGINKLDNQVRYLQVQTQTLQDRLQLAGHHVYVEQVLQETDGLDADDHHFKSVGSDVIAKSSEIQRKYAEAVQHGLKAVLSKSQHQTEGFPQFYNTEAYLDGQDLSFEQSNHTDFLKKSPSIVVNTESMVDDNRYLSYTLTLRDMLEEQVNKALEEA
eukprot:TRINITY_DN4533_c0_g1_i1.p1 TRINITY_DN4533_c0_g1~~TRINITY_DN4533_c0_g1_i1.p1  ORF type:complete len:215 (-),score=24.68 TRINITY_DN4533_c0_g1_i1:18-641(-)